MTSSSPRNLALGRLVSMPLYGIIPSLVVGALFGLAMPGVYWRLPLPFAVGIPLAATITVLSLAARSLARARDGEAIAAPEGASAAAVFATVVGACCVGVGALKMLFNGFMGVTRSPGDDTLGLALMIVPMALAVGAVVGWQVTARAPA